VLTAAAGGRCAQQEAKDDEQEVDTTMVKFENDNKKSLTRVTIETTDKRDLLLELCSALSSLGLSIASAECTTQPDGQVMDVFEVRATSLIPQVTGSAVHALYYTPVRWYPRALNHGLTPNAVSSSRAF
jgi:UTP:GlnB (protein PII) uridylyltransferase